MIVDERYSGFPLPNIPPKSWVVLSIEICIEYQSNYYILLRHPYYARDDNEDNQTNEGFLYPPFFASICDFGMYPPQNVGEWKEKTDGFLSAINISEKLDEMAHLYGLGPLSYTHMNSVFEMKVSPSHGGHNRLYRVERYICTPRGSFNIKNITDPNFLKGHIFSPLFKDSTQQLTEKFRGKTYCHELHACFKR